MRTIETKVYEFDELTEEQKEKTTEKLWDVNVNYEWWESVYEDAVRMGALLGIEIEQRRFKAYGGKTGCEPKIQFSGFCSQSDGASFEGGYRFVPDALLKIQEETDDKELIRIAQELALIQVTRRLQDLGDFKVSVSTSGNYCHSNTMSVTLELDDDSTEDIEPDLIGLEKELTQLMRDFADWIYERLENEHDYLTSDEHIDQYLSEEKFDSLGQVI